MAYQGRLKASTPGWLCAQTVSEVEVQIAIIKGTLQHDGSLCTLQHDCLRLNSIAVFWVHFLVNMSSTGRLPRGVRLALTCYAVWSQNLQLVSTHGRTSWKVRVLFFELIPLIGTQSLATFVQSASFLCTNGGCIIFGSDPSIIRENCHCSYSPDSK